MLSTILSFLIPAMVVLFILKLIALPFKIIFKVLINTILGGALLFILCTLGIITITLTWWMIALVGVFGLAGAVVVAILSFVL